MTEKLEDDIIGNDHINHINNCLISLLHDTEFRACMQKHVSYYSTIEGENKESLQFNIHNFVMPALKDIYYRLLRRFFKNEDTFL